MDEKNNQDYNQVVAAQNEAERRRRIESVDRTMRLEHAATIRHGIIAGIGLVGLITAHYYSNIDIDHAIELEKEALNSIDALKEYLLTFTPAMVGSLAITATGFVNSIRSHRRELTAYAELNDLNTITTESVLDEWNTPQKTK